MRPVGTGDCGKRLDCKIKEDKLWVDRTVRVTYSTNCTSCFKTVKVPERILAELALRVHTLFVLIGCLSFHHFADDVQNDQVGFLPGVHCLHIHDLIAELFDQQIDDDEAQIFEVRKLDLASNVVFGQLFDHLLKNLGVFHRIDDAGQSVEYVVRMGGHTGITTQSGRKR